MDLTEIRPIPEVPSEILHAVNTGTLAVFVGAGASRLVGCLGWPELAHSLVNCCFRTKRGDGSSLISYKEMEFLKRENPKKAITICKGILNAENQDSTYLDILRESLKDGHEIPTPNIYDEIYKLRGLRLTTNADRHFDRLFAADQIISDPRKFSSTKLSTNTLYHLHGSVDSPRTLVFTVPEYLQRYADRNFVRFLQSIFSKHTVLFIGYGLEEIEILDFLFSKANTGVGENEIRHFILMGLFRGDENILAHESRYFQSMNVRVVPFQKDSLGYAQLTEVLKNWNEKIDKRSTFIVSTFLQIEDVVQNFSLPRAREALQLARNDEPQRQKLFRELAKAPRPERWFDLLAEQGYFNPANNPEPIESETDKGYYTIPVWEILGYLENLSQENSKSPDPAITKRLVKLIKEFASFRKKDGSRIENYRTDWVLFKLIFDLPDNVIKINHIRLIEVFLRSKWRSTLIGSDIGKIAIPRLLELKSKKLARPFLRIILSSKIVARKSGDQIESLVDHFWLNEALTAHGESLAKLLRMEAFEETLEAIRKLLREDKHQFNYIWIPTIDGSQDREGERPDLLLIEFLRSVIENVAGSELKADLPKLLGRREKIFHRIALYAVRVHYTETSETFWNWVKDRNPLKDVAIKHEVYSLLKENSKLFKVREVKAVLKWIEDEKAVREGLTAEQREKVEAYRKKEWLTALIESGAKDVIKAFDKYNAINPVEIEHPGHATWMESGWRTGETSPIDLPTFLAKSDAEIASYLKGFVENPSTWDGPSKRGLGETLQEAVKAEPMRIGNALKNLIDVAPVYQYYLLNGLSEAWNQKNPIPWEAVFNFADALVAKSDFWTANFEKGYHYNDWIVAVMSAA